MFDRRTWEFINSFAPWFSAVGTFSAVVVSLYLARRAARPKVRVSSAIVRTVPCARPMPGGSAEFFQIRVVNSGFREVTVSGVMWKQLGWRKQTYVVFPPDDAYSTKLPAKLQYGEQAHFFFQTSEFPRLARALLETLGDSTASSLKLRMLRVGVYASTGEEFLSSLDEHLRKWLVQEAKATSV
jgi:hypothetical protein